MSKYGVRLACAAALAVLATVEAGGAGGNVAASVAPTNASHPAPTGGQVVVASTERVEVDALRAGTTGRYRPAHRSDRGYAYLSSSIVAQTPAGFDVWVDGGAAHHWLTAKNTAAAVKSLRRLGTRVRYRGYGMPDAAEGVVRVLEGPKGCGNGGGTIGMTWTYWNALPSGKNYVTHADVYLCPSLFRMGTWAVRATVGHELGHGMGLGHVPYLYRGSYQLMNPVVRRGVLTYRSGDRHGLRRLARVTRRIAAQVPPTGHLDGSTYVDGAIRFTGWALLRFAKGRAVTIVLTDNGEAIEKASTDVLRRDVNSAQDPGSRRHGFAMTVPWNGGRHTFCVNARSAAHPSASSRLGCVTWHD